MVLAGLITPQRSLFCHPPSCHQQPGWQPRAPSQLQSRRVLHRFKTVTHASAEGSHPGPADGSSQVPPAPPGSAYASKVDTIPPDKLKELRRTGLAMKDRINMGRRGVAPGFVSQIYTRWNTSEVAKLYCTGKHAANIKVLTQQLEERTGGVVVQKAGGSVFLYRGEPWPRDPPVMPAASDEEVGEGSGSGLTSASVEGSHPGPADSGRLAAPAAKPPSPRYVSRVTTIPADKLKELRTMGLAMKDRITMGSRGVTEEFVLQIYTRWKTSEIAKLYCKGKHAANSKLLTQQLEERTGGIVAQKAGGSVFLYRGEPWPRDPPVMPAASDEEVREGRRGGTAAATKAAAGNQKQQGASRAANRRSSGGPAPGTASAGQQASKAPEFDRGEEVPPPSMAEAGQGQ